MCYQDLRHADGCRIEFRGFLDPLPKIETGGLVYESPEPNCAFYEKPGEISPALRTHVDRVSNAIAQEMAEVYHMKVDRNPLILRFPKSVYAKRIERVKATMMDFTLPPVPQAFQGAFKDN